MDDLPESLFKNPVWHALHTTHRRFAIHAGHACRYPADVAPFAAAAEPSMAAMGGVHSLVAPGESVWVIGENFPEFPGLSIEEILPCLQMVLPGEVMPCASSADIVPLSGANADEMVALTTLAFPGFFRRRTFTMGSYYGVRSKGELVAMGGERLMLPGYPEISAVCTHPDHRGKGLASGLIWQLVRKHRRDGLVSWLHVGADNRTAIDLYLRMGFRPIRTIQANRMSRES